MIRHFDSTFRDKGRLIQFRKPDALSVRSVNEKDIKKENSSRNSVVVVRTNLNSPLGDEGRRRRKKRFALFQAHPPTSGISPKAPLMEYPHPCRRQPAEGHQPIWRAASSEGLVVLVPDRGQF